MNYFGMFFTFMIPGLVLGALFAIVVREEKDKRAAKRRAAALPAQPVTSRDRLYVYDLRQDAGNAA